MTQCALGSGCRYPNACMCECLAQRTLFDQCSECKGNGYTKAYLVADDKTVKQAMERPDIFNDLTLPVHKDECKRCGGTGKIAAEWVK
jgi:hypothetical protein